MGTSSHTHRRSGLYTRLRRIAASERSTQQPLGRRYYQGQRFFANDFLSNECKRTKVKCIRKEGDVACQRCTTMKFTCVVIPTAIQSAKDNDKEKLKTKLNECVSNSLVLYDDYFTHSSQARISGNLATTSPAYESK